MRSLLPQVTGQNETVYRYTWNRKDVFEFCTLVQETVWKIFSFSRINNARKHVHTQTYNVPSALDILKRQLLENDIFLKFHIYFMCYDLR